MHTSNPPGTPAPIGPYSHVVTHSSASTQIQISGTAGVDAHGRLAGPDVYSQARQILALFKLMLESVNSDLQHLTHVNIFLLNMADFPEMNRAYAEALGTHRPARTTVGVAALPKPGAVITMNATAVARSC